MTEHIIIHIGYHKSASTFLQQTVFPALPINNFFFAGPKQLYLNLINSDEFNGKKFKNVLESELKETFKESETRTTILSHEQLSGHPHGYSTVEPKRIAQRLHEMFPKSRILIVIRNQMGYLTSIYTYRVAIKGYESRSFSRFLEEEGAKGLFTHLEYDNLIQFYKELFGDEQVLVLPMEGLVKEAPDVWGALFHFFGIDPQHIESSAGVNVSTKLRPVLRFWRPINYVFGAGIQLLTLVTGKRHETAPFQALRAQYYQLKRWGTNRINRRFADREKIDIAEEPLYKDLLTRFSASNLRLNELIPWDPAEYGYPGHD
ncbi:MAG: sulfotransferase domain-containing protein [Chloroflexota bacterium]